MLLNNITMSIYKLSFYHIGDTVVFKIGLDNQAEQFEICSSNYNPELYVSLFDGYEQKEKDGSIVKIKLKTLMNLITIISKGDIVIQYFIKSNSFNDNIFGKITHIFLKSLKKYCKNGYIKINLYNIYKVVYDNFTDKIEFKNIFYDDIVNIGNLNDKYQIILSTKRLFDLVISYKSLYKIIYSKINRLNIDILDIMKNDIYLCNYIKSISNVKIKLIIDELNDIEFTNKNEIKYFFIHFYCDYDKNT